MRAVGSRFSRDAVFASLVGAAVFGIYMIGAGRAFNLDASVTVARYVSTPSLLDPLRHQFVYNNHVFFSLADHLVYSVTGSRSEVVLRLLPVMAAAIALGVLALVLARWTDWVAAVTATALAAWTPLLLTSCREVRGYSFLLLSATISTALFVRMRQGPERAGRVVVAAYIGSLAFGIATHAYAAVVMLLHAAALGADRRALREWAPRWTAALVIGLLPLAGVAHEMVSAGGARGRVFQPRFPLDLARALLGGAAIPVAVTGVVAALGAAELVARAAWVRRVAVVLVVAVGAIWLLAPRDLYPRFFVWLVPVVAACTATAIHRRRWLVVAALPLVVAQAVRLAPSLSEPELANRSAARMTDQAVAHGRRVCTFGLSNLALEAYTSRVHELGPHLDGLDSCDLVVQVFTPVPSELTWPPQVAASFPRRVVLAAAHPGVVSARVPLR